MQEISTLAARLKKQIEQENETIQNLTREQLGTMRTELNAILQHELNIIKSDIREHSKDIGWKAFRSRALAPTMIGIFLCLGLFGGSWGMMEYLSGQLTSLIRQEAMMRKNVTKLEEQGGKIQISKCGDNSRLCVRVNPKSVKFGSIGEDYRILEGY